MLKNIRGRARSWWFRLLLRFFKAFPSTYGNNPLILRLGQHGSRHTMWFMVHYSKTRWSWKKAKEQTMETYHGNKKPPDRMWMSSVSKWILTRTTARLLSTCLLFCSVQWMDGRKQDNYKQTKLDYRLRFYLHSVIT